MFLKDHPELAGYIIRQKKRLASSCRTAMIEAIADRKSTPRTNNRVNTLPLLTQSSRVIANQSLASSNESRLIAPADTCTDTGSMSLPPCSVDRNLCVSASSHELLPFATRISSTPQSSSALSISLSQFPAGYAHRSSLEYDTALLERLHPFEHNDAISIQSIAAAQYFNLIGRYLPNK